jgi:hypothetical protein
MKFLPVALSALVGVASAKKSFSGAKLRERMNKGKFDKKALLKNAKPYDRKTKRKLDEEEAWEINGYYSIQYDTCLNLKVESEDLIDEDYINYAANGQLVATKSYILFDVCATMNCYYDGDDSKMSFIVDIPSFFEAFVEYLPNQVEEYCKGCEENEDYCLGNLDAQQDGDGDGAEQEEAEEDNGERKLKKTGRRKLENGAVVEYINCDQCEAYECFEAEDEDGQEEEDDGEQYDFEDAIEWLYGLSECSEMEDAAWNNLALSAGLICNDDGSGIEVGVFADEDCTIFAPGLSYANYMAYDAQTYYGMSAEVVEYMFTNDFSCYYQEVEYINPYTEMDDEEENQEEDNGEAPEAAEWCQQLFNGDFAATNTADCGADGDEEQEEQEEQEEDENAVNYDWYTYDLTEDQMEDTYEVCQVINAIEGDYQHVYDSKSSGRLYNYKRNKNQSNSGGLGAGAIVFILLATIGVAAAGVVLYTKSKKGEGDKKAPLINDGTMA